MLNVTEQRQIICFIVLSILKGNFKSESTADRCATKILHMFEEIIIKDFHLILGLIKHHYLHLFRVVGKNLHPELQYHTPKFEK